MSLADVSLVRRNAAHVIWILGRQVVVKVMKCLPHFTCVLLIDTKDNGLGEAVGLPHEIREIACDGICASTQRDHSFEVLGLVFVVRNLPSVAIELLFAWTPASCIPLRYDAVDAVRREESILYSLP